MMQWMPSIVGRLLRGKRAGVERTLFKQADSAHLPASIVVTSSDFSDGGQVPPAHTADGAGIPPSLAWGPLPPLTRCVAILVEDADSPTTDPFVHLVAWWAGSAPGHFHPGDLDPRVGSTSLLVGRNGMMQSRWMPPDPPPGHGAHRYLFQVYALSQAPVTSRRPSRRVLAHALPKHGLAKGALIGTYERQGSR